MAAGSGGEGAPASSGSSSLMSDYLLDADHPNAIHRRAASLVIVRSGAGAGAAGDDDGPRVVDGHRRDDRRAQSTRRRSLSLWRSSRAPETAAGVGSRTPFWGGAGGWTWGDGGKDKGGSSSSTWRSWKPVRALAHLGKRRAGCLFSVEVDAARGVPASMEGFRLAVTVRKAETRDGAVQTLPCRVRDGSADFDETLFFRCNLYFTGGAGTGKPLRLEPRRFVVSVVAVDGRGALLGTHTVDVTSLVLESLDMISSEGRRVRWFHKTLALSAGKAAAGGGELHFKLGFQLMEDAGLSLYAQALERSEYSTTAVSSRARAHDKNSFSISSTAPKLPSLLSDASISPSMRAYKQLVDRLRLDENGDPDHHPAVRSLIPREPGDDELSAASTTDAADDMFSLQEYDVVDKGVETVKEVVHYQAQRDVLRELDSIAEQIEAIEALMTNGGKKSPNKAADQQQRLDADEEMVTVQFLRKLEVDGDKKKLYLPATPRSVSASPRKAAATPPVVPDLGRGIGPAVQTRDGGFLVSMNPFDLPLASRDGPPKLAMQVSRPFVLPGAMAATGFDVLQKMAAAGGADEVRDRVASLGGMENITGKTPEQVGFEGIAAAVIGGRRTTEGASSSAARSVQLVRKLATALSQGRSERVSTGIWTAVGDDPETLEEVLAFSLQKLETMAVDALAIQAEMADEDAPFEVSAAAVDTTSVFDSLVPSDEWSESAGGGSDGRVTLVAAIQVRDPWRRYEAVGAPMVAVVQSARLLGAAGYGAGRFKVRSVHVGGVQMRCPPSGGGGSASWGAERQKLTAMQWMLAHGPAAARAGKRATTPTAPQARARGQRPDVVWSLSSRVLAGMWLKTVRNPDVRIGGGGSGGT